MTRRREKNEYGNRKCDCGHYYANHRMGERGYGECHTPGYGCEGVHHRRRRYSAAATFMISALILGCSDGDFQIGASASPTLDTASATQSADARPTPDASPEPSDAPQTSDTGGADTASTPDDAAPMPDAALTPDVATDTSPTDTYIAPLGVCSLPSSATASAATVHESYVPNKAIDGDLTSRWSAMAKIDRLTVSFGKLITFDSLRIAPIALPATTHGYKISGLKNGASTLLATVSRPAPEVAMWGERITFARGSYDAIVIDIDGGDSWAAIAELEIKDTSCP